MNRKSKRQVLAIILISITAYIACNKDSSTGTDSSSTSSTIAVAATADSTTDSVYLVQPCAPGSSRDSIAETDVPAAVTAYLAANYSGYTFSKAFTVTDSSGTISGMCW